MPPVNSAHELGWTLETLRVHLEGAIRSSYTHLEERIKAVADTAQAAAQNADKAVSKAETAAEKRFESVNEFRNTLSDQQRNLMPRDEANIRFEALTHEIRGAQHILENMRAEQKGVVGDWGYAIGVVGLVLTLVTLGILVMQSVKTP